MDATSTIPATMLAWIRRDYGPADGTRLADVPTPAPDRGEVLVRVRATALSAGDVRLLLGDPLLVRLVYGIRRPRQPVRGIDIAGTVVALGDAVPTDLLGAEVVVELPAGGGLAAYAVAPAGRLVRRPADLAPEVAATLPVSGGTAFQALDSAGVTAGNRVLVLGASGGVGTFAVQLAAARGAEVHATCGARNRALVERLGAVRTFDYRTSNPGALEQEAYDAVVDIAGSWPLRALQRLVVDGGSIVAVAADGGGILGPIPRMLRGAVLSIGSRRRIRFLAAAPERRITEELIALVRSTRIAPVIEHVYDFDDADDALARVSSGHVAGKVVVRAAG